MDPRTHPPTAPVCVAQAARLAVGALLACAATHALAQTAPGAGSLATPTSAPAWADCMALRDDAGARLACFDHWAQQQVSASAPQHPAPASLATSAAVPTTAAATEPSPQTAAPTRSCKDKKYSELSRFWELEAGSDCGSFRIKGYHPISLSWIGANSVNRQPTSPSVDHTPANAVAYDNNEARIQLSVRSKIAQGLLTHGHATLRDSLWFGYTQKSNWQLYNSDISRPFRTTDHEPELTYIYPTDVQLSNGWRLRYSGVSVVHQSNGQSLPLSRSWNRTVLLAGLEHGDAPHNDFTVTGKLWQRIPEASDDDDNPGIENYIGRAELSAYWNVNANNTLGVTLRHPLTAQTNGSIRLEWLKKLSDDNAQDSGLRFHTQLFSGYGDSLVDYNRRRTVLSIGLSLVDW